VEAILPIECEIPSLKLAVELLPNTSAEEECLLYLMRLEETRHDATLVIEAQKNHVKAQYDKHAWLFTGFRLGVLLVSDTHMQLTKSFGYHWFQPHTLGGILLPMILVIMMMY
jgi:hypothetical protein